MGKQVVRIGSIVGTIVLVPTILSIAIVNLIASTATLLHLLGSRHDDLSVRSARL